MLRETIYRDEARRAADALVYATYATPAGHRPAPDGARSPQDAFESHLAHTLVHTWDLAQALQLDFDPPRPAALDITRGWLSRISPGSRGLGNAFAAIPGLPSGSAMEEVLLLSGRSPSWNPPR